MAIADELTEEIIPDVELDKVDEDFRFHISKDTMDSVIRTFDTEADYSNINFLEGKKWTVDYYNQDLGTNDSGSLLDSALPAVLSPRTKILGMTLMVTESTDEALYASMTGSALFYAGSIRPYVGDVFIVPILNKKLGIFQVSAVKTKTYVNKDMYEISYSIYIIDDTLATNNFLAVLEASVNRRFKYNKDFMRNRSSVLFTEEEADRYNTIREHMGYIANKWVKTFRDYRTNLITIKRQSKIYVDFNLEKFFISILDNKSVEDSPIYANTIYSPFGGRFDTDTILNLFLNKKNLKLSDVSKYVMKLCDMGVIDYDLRGGDLSGLGFNCMIFVYRDNCMLSEIGNTGSCFSLLEFSESCSTTNSTLLPNIKEISKTSKHYMFSENFYLNKRESISILEELLLDYIEDKDLDITKLFLLKNSVNSWNFLEQFYYIPMLYLLEKYYVEYAYSFVSRNF